MLSRRRDQSALRATRRFQPKQTPVSPTLSPALRIATRGRGRKLGPVLYEGWLYFRQGQNPIVFPDGTARIAKTAGKGLSVSRDRFPSDSQKVPTRFPQGSHKVPGRSRIGRIVRYARYGTLWEPYGNRVSMLGMRPNHCTMQDRRYAVSSS